MNKNRKSIHSAILILALAIIAVLFFVLLFLRVGKATPSQPVQQAKGLAGAQYAVGVLRAGSLDIPVSFATTPTEQQQGLSGTPSLPSNSGKLFVFTQPGNYGFWMKDMEYGLDFIWFDSSMKIDGITSNVAATTYPKIFYPPQPAQYVLEVNAGFSTAHSLTIGEQFTLQ